MVDADFTLFIGYCQVFIVTTNFIYLSPFDVVRLAEGYFLPRNTSMVPDSISL